MSLGSAFFLAYRAAICLGSFNLFKIVSLEFKTYTDYLTGTAAVLKAFFQTAGGIGMDLSTLYRLDFFFFSGVLTRLSRHFSSDLGLK